MSHGNVNKTDEPSAFIDVLGGDDLLPPKNQSGKSITCTFCTVFVIVV